MKHLRILIACLACATCAALLALPSLASAVGETGTGSSVDGSIPSWQRDGVTLGCDYCHQGGVDDKQGPHGGFTASTDTCWVCHAVHSPRAAGPGLLFRETATELCLACHDGTGGNGVYGTIKARTGADPGSAHRSSPDPVTNVVPGGSATTGGDRVATGFTGDGGFLSCSDCHNPHGSNVVAPFATERPRSSGNWTDRSAVMSTNLLRTRPNGSDTTATVYGSDWCRGCHQGRHSGGAVVNHPVDSSVTNATPYSYQNLPVSPWLGVMDIATDAAGNVYVPDPGNHRVQKFTSAGAYVSQWSAGKSGSLLDPRGVTVAGGSVFVTDPQAAYIARYTTAGVLQTTFGTPGGRYGAASAGYYQTPGGLGTDPSGSLLFITDTERQVTSVSDAATTAFVRVMGRQWFPSPWAGTGADDAYEPTDVAADSEGNVYVVDSMNDRIKKFDPDGNRLLDWGSSGRGDGQFQRPMSIAIDSSDRVYVADAGNHRIQRFDAVGGFQVSWGSLGAGNGQFRVPRGITVNSAGDVYVVDAGNDRIQQFTSDGVFLAAWGTRGTGNSQFDFNPVSIASLGPWSRAQGNPAYAGRGFVMSEPRTTAQQGRGPICQQCHEDSRRVGDLYDGVSLPAGPEMIGDGWLNTWWWSDGGGNMAGPRDVGNPRFTNFPHETVNEGMLVETNDDLCMNCHDVTRLP